MARPRRSLSDYEKRADLGHAQAMTEPATTQGDQVIGRSTSESTPWWPEPVLPATGTPNVVVVLLDDTGFAHLGCYGGLVDTPNYDRLAERGLRYTNFHTTALCSPTRACLLTGPTTTRWACGACPTSTPAIPTCGAA